MVAPAGLALCLLMFCISSVSLDAVDQDQNNALVAVEVEDEDNADAQESVQIGDGEDEVDVFYPTKEWKTIGDGQAIPKGLHVRMNLQTGHKEAKLMDGDSGIKYWQQGDKRGMVNTDRKQFTAEELKRALKEFKATQDDVRDDKIKQESLKKKFKSYEELKEDMAKFNMNVKTDQEIITELFEELKEKKLDNERQMTILTDLEYYVHQMDNAQHFAGIGGLDVCVKLLNHSNIDIRGEAALVLGSAMQGNPKVQIAAMEVGAVPRLIRVLSTESSSSVQRRLLYAMATLLRQFPYAQQKFLEHGGLNVLKQLFQHPDNFKLQVKAITLLNDLLTERNLAERHLDKKNVHHQEKIQQYLNAPLLQSLLDQGWCELIPRLLDTPDHDTREKILNAMHTLQSSCMGSFKMARKTLDQLKTEYDALSLQERQDEEEDLYFSKMSKTINQLISQMSSGQKDEL
ncbi:nucleotide exchange factor SIL1 isoform X2 [Lingula anatina]|nr:nucleotide exchange factor SIL1 isoform X2 [Lingula anatina]|eukprot:XP_013389967.1 nucleotide exchange factor SIL1 isoform X2 [Lingula anatina]